MNLVSWIIRLLILLMIIRFVMSLFAGARSRRPAGPPPSPKRPAERIGGTLVRDPHCGTYLPQDRAMMVVSSGTPQYFCSTKCRDEWQAGVNR